MPAAGQTIPSADFLPADDTSIATAASGFSINQQVARTMLGGKIVYIHLIITSTNAITASGGGFNDVTMATLDAAFWPTEAVNAVAAAAVTGEAQLTAAGQVILRSASDTVAAGSNLLMTFNFIRD